MKLRKYIRKYMTVFLLLCLLFIINVVPIGAITASGGVNDYIITDRSTFPLTVGFGYKIIPGDSQSPTMVFSNELGGYGQEVQGALHGQDYYEFKYPVAVGEPFNQQGKGVYYYDFLDKTTGAYTIRYSDGSYNSAYNFGYQHMRLNNSAFFSDPYDPTLNFMNNRENVQQCIVFKARDVVYNSHYLYGMDNVYYTDPLQAMMPSIIMFNNDNMLGFEDDNAYYVYHYTYKVDFVDLNGTTHSYSGGWYHNTRDDPQKVVPLIPLNTMQQMTRYGNSFVIDDFQGVLSATYYERPLSYVLNGTWVLKSPYVNQPLFGVDQVGPITTAACSVSSYYDDGSLHSLNSGLEQAVGYYPDDSSARTYITNGSWSSGTKNFGSLSATSSEYVGYYGAKRIDISNWDYANNANYAWWNFLNMNYLQMSEGDPDPNQGSTEYRQKGLAGKGLDVDLYYPILNRDDVVHTGTSVYKQYYDWFGFPYVAKFIRDYGSNIDAPAPPPLEDTDFSTWLVNAVGGFVGFELWPGFSIGSILSVCIAVPLVLWFLKMFAGG